MKTIEINEGGEVEFIVGENKITAKVVDNEIRIYSDGLIYITPWATNSIRIWADRYNETDRAKIKTSLRKKEVTQ